MTLVKQSLLALVLATAAVVAQASDVSKRVLFVGNSFSYFNNGIQNHYGNLIRANGDWITGTHYTRLKTISGGRLDEHGPGLKLLIERANKRKPYDGVVIQGYSNGPIDGKRSNRFFDGADQLANYLNSQKIKPYFFATWAYGGMPTMMPKLEAGYASLAKKHNGTLLPVGRAFEMAQKAYPEINLYSADVKGVEDGKVVYKPILKHPSMAGTYLAAATIYATIQKRSPEGNIYTAGLPVDVATKLQTIAYQAAVAASDKSANQ